jgi:hypothetical protein
LNFSDTQILGLHSISSYGDTSLLCLSQRWFFDFARITNAVELAIEAIPFQSRLRELARLAGKAEAFDPMVECREI